MIEWWNGLDLVMKVLYCIAVPATLILIIQTILSLAGGFEGGSGVDFSDTSGLDMGDMGGADIGELADASDGGFAGDGGNPADFGIGSMFTLQGIVTFLTVFGWTAIVGINSGAAEGISAVVGVLLGVVAMYAVARLMFASRKLTENGTINLRNAIGESAKVYIPVPAGEQGEGKITLTLQGRFVECSAVTEETEPLKTGTYVRVIDVRNEIAVVESEK